MKINKPFYDIFIYFSSYDCVQRQRSYWSFSIAPMNFCKRKSSSFQLPSKCITLSLKYCVNSNNPTIKNGHMYKHISYILLHPFNFPNKGFWLIWAKIPLLYLALPKIQNMISHTTIISYCFEHVLSGYYKIFLIVTLMDFFKAGFKGMLNVLTLNMFRHYYNVHQLFRP